MNHLNYMVWKKLDKNCLICLIKMIFINACSFNLFALSFMNELPLALWAKPSSSIGRSSAIPPRTPARFTGRLKTLLLALSPIFTRRLSPLLLLKKSICFIYGSPLSSPQKKPFLKLKYFPPKF